MLRDALPSIEEVALQCNGLNRATVVAVRGEGRIRLTAAEFASLADEQCLVSEVINFYFDILQNRCLLTFPRSLFFPAYIMTVFCPNQGGNLSNAPILEFDGSNVRQTGTVQIEKDQVPFEGFERTWDSLPAKLGGTIDDFDQAFFPLCFEMHWSLLVLFPKENTLKHFNSLHTGKERSQVINTFKLELNKLRDVVIEFKEMEVPKQTNSYDCGVFLLKFAEELSIGEDLSAQGFAEKEMREFRRKIQKEIVG